MISLELRKFIINLLKIINFLLNYFIKKFIVRNILVTGGCGYIGSHTVLTLLERGYFVYIFDSNINSSPTVVNRLKELISVKGSELSKNLFFLRRLKNIRDIEEIFLKQKVKVKALIALYTLQD